MTDEEKHELFLQLEEYYRNVMSITTEYNNYGELVLKGFKDQAVFITEFLSNQYVQALEMFWKHPQLTPQEVSDALGTSAGSLFAFYGDLKTAIETHRPSLPVPPVSAYGTVTVNPDGTVTVDSIVG
jgi:hypothetical protein